MPFMRAPNCATGPHSEDLYLSTVPRALRSPRLPTHRGDAVHAAAIAGDDVLCAFDRDSGTEDVAKQVELRRTETLTHARRGADGAVVFDEQKPVAVAPHLGHVAFLGPLLRQRAQLVAERRRARHARAVERPLRGAARVEHLLNARLPECLTERADERDAQLGIRVRKQAIRFARE